MAGFAEGFILGFGKAYGDNIAVDVMESKAGYSNLATEQ